MDEQKDPYPICPYGQCYKRKSYKPIIRWHVSDNIRPYVAKEEYKDPRPICPYGQCYKPIIQRYDVNDVHSCAIKDYSGNRRKKDNKSYMHYAKYLFRMNK